MWCHCLRGAFSAISLGLVFALSGCGGGRVDQAPTPEPAIPAVAPPAPSAVETAQKERAEESSPSRNQAAGSGWGKLTGRFVFEGTPPVQQELRITSDVEYCSMHHPLDESLVVHAENRGVANVVVSLYRSRGEEPPPVHPSFQETADQMIELDNLKCRFQPHVVLLRTSQTLQILNTDEVAHNAKIDALNNPPINPTLPAGGSLLHRFEREERSPARVSCSIHPWMIAWVVVREDPYCAASDTDGLFAIDRLPAGRWTFQVWHEKARYVNQVTQGGAATEWPRGRFVTEIQADEVTDLGEIGLAASLFEG